MLVTVAICTWNRAESLGRTLSELRELEIPPGVEWELVVVNNNCTDHTDDVLRQHADHLPIRRVFEAEQGLSAARNCAVAAAKGELILWTDDDILVDPEWLAQYVRAVRARPEASFFGGPITPYFSSSPQPWLRDVWDQVSHLHGARDDSPEPFAFTVENLPLGGNYAVRAEVQRRYPYDTRYGRKQDGQLRGSESTVLEQMVADGLDGRWVPGARVRHHVPEDHQTLAYYRSYYYQAGRCAAMRDRDLGEHQDLRSRLYLVRQVLKGELKYRLRRILCKPHVWIEDLRQLAYHWGRLLG